MTQLAVSCGGVGRLLVVSLLLTEGRNKSLVVPTAGLLVTLSPCLAAFMEEA